jgi:molecular chaperone GrpE (heat shock protein)
METLDFWHLKIIQSIIDANETQITYSKRYVDDENWATPCELTQKRFDRYFKDHSIAEIKISVNYAVITFDLLK